MRLQIPDQTYTVDNGDDPDGLMPLDEFSKDVEDAKRLLINLQNLVSAFGFSFMHLCWHQA
jgi:hypothetical protein